jgi:hypothetical protein
VFVAVCEAREDEEGGVRHRYYVSRSNVSRNSELVKMDFQARSGGGSGG